MPPRAFMQLTIPGGTLEIDYWRPDARLARLVSGYHRYAVRLEAGGLHDDVLFPGWANLRFHLRGDRWTVTIGSRMIAVPARAVLFGPTSRAIYSRSDAGIVVGAGLTPRGWRRLGAVPAEHVADRVVPLAEVVADADRMLADLAGAERDGTVSATFDRWLATLLAVPAPDETRVEALHALLMNEEGLTVQDLADRLALTQRQLANVARRSFGFPPKLLLRRARFLRSLLRLGERHTVAARTVLDPSYADYSHFLRDSRAFIGMAPHAFLALPKPLMQASMIARQRTLGAPAQALSRTRDRS